MRTFVSLFAVALTALASATVGAVVPHGEYESPSVLVVPPGADAPRAVRAVTTVPPALANTTATGSLAAGQWRYLWDGDLATPLRIYGSGIDAPGSVDDPAAASRSAAAFLAEHIAMLAPGASTTDFVETINRRTGDTRMVVLGQRYRGIPVEGGSVSFRFKSDRLIVIGGEAFPHVSVSSTAVPGSFDAQVAAATWIDTEFGATSTISDIGAAVVLPIVVGPGDVRYHVATPVVVESARPFGQWTVWVDGAGATVARRTHLSGADGTVFYNVPERWPGGTTRSDFPASDTALTIDGQAQTSDGAGLVTFPGATAAVDTTVAGPFVSVSNQAGANASASFTLADGDSISWSEPDDQFIDGQLTTFIHLNIAKEYARQFAPGLGWLDQTMQADVNIADACNAFSNGDSVFFFAEGSIDVGELGVVDCNNTARLADVVYHEFGHSLHAQSTITNFDSPFSEGLSDFYAANIQNDSEMGLGFFFTEDALRPMELTAEPFWPQGISTRIPHTTGVVFASSMWDLRRALFLAHGEQAGQELINRLFYAAVERAADIPSTYVEILAEDDDDGNIGNGTPNKCLIDFAFGTHGVGETRDLLGYGLGAVERERWDIALPVITPSNGCPAPEVTSVELVWRLRGDDQSGGTVAMDLSSGAYRGTIPVQDEGVVIQYQVAVTYADGNRRQVPLNGADPFYEFFNGDVEEIYCTDFETDPSGEWTASNSASQWEWGAPQGGLDNFDPPAAFSGTNVFGVELGGAGSYSQGDVFFVDSPTIDTTGRDNVRLQYRRWLGTEDERLDAAVIYANNVEKWRNVTANSVFFQSTHADHEWRFHDVDVSAEAASGSLTLRFEQTTNDDTAVHGGWTLDDLCVVAFVPSVCGDGNVSGNETCDSGMENSDEVADACRSNCEPASCGDTVIDTGEECDDGNNVDDDDCSNTCIDISESGGCGCQTGSGSGAGGLVLLGLVALGLRRRRK